MEKKDHTFGKTDTNEMEQMENSGGMMKEKVLKELDNEIEKMDNFSAVDMGTTIATMEDCVGVNMGKTFETDNFCGANMEKQTMARVENFGDMITENVTGQTENEMGRMDDYNGDLSIDVTDKMNGKIGKKNC